MIFDGLQEVAEFDGTSGTAGEPPTRTQTTTRRLDEVIGSSLPPGAGETTRPWRTHHGDLIQSGTGSRLFSGWPNSTLVRPRPVSLSAT